MCGLDWSGSGQGPVAGCCEHAEEKAFSLLEVTSRRSLVGYKRFRTKYLSLPLGVKQSKKTV
jgi:hypothetical protein